MSTLLLFEHLFQRKITPFTEIEKQTSIHQSEIRNAKKKRFFFSNLLSIYQFQQFKNKVKFTAEFSNNNCACQLNCKH